MNHIASNWPIYVASIIALAFVVLYVKRGSIKGVFLGGRIKDTIGQARGASSLGVATQVTVHTLVSSDPSKAVAIEISTKVLTRVRWTPVTVSKDEAIKLARLLVEAADKPSN